ncbi:alpha/beta hydrolase [Mycobacterium sp. Aquia_213]|uniref:alpha/beta hydrolase n=1 Tax=Mycobacterium sp. Aquia_213 TaxID=2991728 RepID=UPI00226D4D37|nr:alpha/beta fold hydrolase [Mycobacterium sp. Aquia_213]WAC93537.1 alpha/beta fold hydrolase [Mycobacterium sp. Aquia_213]
MTASTVTDWEKAEIDKANASGLTPVVFVHGLWLLSSSWQRWRELFEANGYTTIAPGWPDDPATVAEAFEHPEVFAHKKVQAVTDHYLDAIGQLTKKPAVVGHSFGGLIAQKIAGSGASVVTVSIDNAPFRGILPLPISALRSSFPVLGNPANYGKAVVLTFDQFKYGWANNLDEAEARELYETYHVPAPGLPLFQEAISNFNPVSETRVDSKNPDRGPLLIIAGENDHTIPLAITEATYKLQSKHNPGVTEIERIPARGHSLVIDSGWKEVADVSVKFIQRFT